MFNKLLFKIHGWLGLNLGLILFVICFSGTFATLSNEVDWLVNEDMRIEKKDSNPDWQKMTASLDEAFPEGVNLGMYKGTYAGNEDYFATVAYILMPNNYRYKVYLNPTTGEIKGKTSFFNTQRFFRSFHRRFFDGNRGIFLVTLLSIPMLVIVVVGFLFYKGWLKNLFTLRLHRKKRIKWSDTHKLAGIWSLLFALLITITGIFYFYEVILLSVDKNDQLAMSRPDQVAASTLSSYGSSIELKSINTYVDSALSAYPGFDVHGIRLPQKAGDFVYIDGQEGNPITRDRANFMLLDPATAEVVHKQTSSEMTAMPFLADIADPLHFGYFGGLATKIIWFIFGLIISISILSGTYIWVIKTVKKNRKRKPGSDGFPWLRGVTVSVTITILYMIWVSFAAFEGIRSYGPMPEPVTQKITANNIGDWKFEMQAAHYFNDRDIENLEIIFPDDRLPNIREIKLVLAQDSGKDSSHLFKTRANKYQLDIDDSLYQQIKAVNDVTVQVKGYDGSSYNYPLASASLLTGLKIVSEQVERYPAEIQPAWPEHHPGIWIYIGSFILLTVAVILLWTRWLMQTIRSTLVGKTSDTENRPKNTPIIVK